MQVSPISRFPAVSAEVETGVGPLPGTPIIAVVDDDPSILRALDRLMRSRGCRAQVFTSPAAFLGSVSHSVPDCLIIDVQMPGMSGLELHLRLLDQGLRIPVIFITAHEDPDAEARAASAGAAGFFYKPFRNDKLWEAVRQALSHPKS